MHDYAIRGGREGRSRLRTLADALRPSTLDLFRTVGLSHGMRALDLGCGGGDVTLDMARAVGPEGRVVGVDIDGTNVEAARQRAADEGISNVEFRLMDAHELGNSQTFDRVYARFLLTHLDDPAELLRTMIDATTPGGIVLIEDIEHAAIFTYPESDAVARYVHWYGRTIRAKGGDPEIGPKLPGMVRALGLGDIGLRVVHPVFMEGPAKQMHRITLENIADSVVATATATREEIDATIAGIEAFTQRPETIVSLPRIFQVWGRRG